ncbi:DNA-3-methyladenine glycosylase [bacterium]|nr:DNA-3-methyladenine glycosylase [bacterium]
MKNRLKRKFFTRSTLEVAKDLLGKYLVRKIGKRKLVGKIVETEAYIGPKDKASHSYKGKITERNKAEYLIGGCVYIYLVYGMYWQLNITTSKEGKPECVLIRAIEPIKGLGKIIKKSEIPTNGPGKLCKWLKLDKSFYAEDLTKSKRLWIEEGEKIKEDQIVRARRIGIDYAGLYWSRRKWRFYIKDNPFVSKK